MAKLLRIAVVSTLAMLSLAQSAWAICDAEFDLFSNANGWSGVARTEGYKQHQRKEQFGFLNVITGYVGDKGKIRAYIVESIASHKKSLANDVTSKYHAGKVASYLYDLCMLDSTPIGSTQRASENKNSSTNEQLGSTTVTPSQRASSESLQSQSSQQLAQQTQSRADQQRQGKRKTHDPAAEAHECIAIDKAGSGNYGAFKNQCPYPVNFTTCNEKPRIIQGGFNWSADFDCAKQQFGLHTPKGNSSVAAHNRNTEFVYWFACKAPAMPVDATYAAGKGIEARCHN